MTHLVFRRDPDIQPTNKVSIFGRSRCSAGRMRAYAARRNPRAPDVAELYLERSVPYGIRGDLAFCQAMLDTQVWTAEPQGPPWKPFAYAIWGGLAFSDQSEEEFTRRVDRHLQTLSVIVDSHKTDEPCWEDLSGRWAISDGRYGYDIVAIWRNMTVWRGAGSVGGEEKSLSDAATLSGGGADSDEAGLEAAVGTSREERVRPDYIRADSTGRIIQANSAIQADRTAGDHLSWLSAHAWVPTPPPHPGRKVSWGELARVINSLEKRRGKQQ